MCASMCGGHKLGGGDCLLKTQGCAKPQGDVYSLTPARCWKIKRRGASSELKSQ
jgi:hypothetical protein